MQVLALTQVHVGTTCKQANNKVYKKKPAMPLYYIEIELTTMHTIHGIVKINVS